jgi:hypothetical protein
VGLAEWAKSRASQSDACGEMTGLIRKINRDALIETVIKHLDTGKAWPAHVHEALMERGITKLDIELRLRERAVVFSWMTMVGGMLAMWGLLPFGYSSYDHKVIAATTCMWLFYFVLRTLRGRRLYLPPWGTCCVGVIAMMLVSCAIQSALVHVVLPLAVTQIVSTIMSASGLIALFLQYKTFASTKVLKGITIS